jgi:hypothetical protein
MYLNLNFCTGYSGSDREGDLSKALKPFFTREVPAFAPSPNHLPLIQKPDIIINKPRGPCAWRNRPATPHTSRRQQGVPALAPSSSHPSSVRSSSSPSSLSDAWWPPEWIPSPLGAPPPWHFAPPGASPRRQGLPLEEQA